MALVSRGLVDMHSRTLLLLASKRFHLTVLCFVFLISTIVSPGVMAISTNGITDSGSSAAADCSNGARDARGDLYSSNNIPGFFDPCGSTCDTSTLGVVTGVQVDGSFTLGTDASMRPVVLAKQLMSDYGLTENQASGIVGNFMVESGPSLPPNINEGGSLGPPKFSGGYGWAQWTAGRQTEFIEYAISKDYIASGQDANDAANYAFLTYELSGGYKSTITKIKETNTTDAATISFESTFEKAGVPALGKRASYASAVAKAIQSGTGVDIDSATALSSTTGSGTCQSSAIPAGNFVETVKAFAWEDGRRGSNQKTAYSTVIKTSKYGNDSAHKYGNDCGAFVYNLMVVSGFDPNYKGTNTSGQIAWLNNPINGWKKIYGVGQVDVGELQPGDIGIKQGHVFVWIGTVDGFKGKSAEAALGSNTAPTAILSSNTYSSPSRYSWYRKSADIYSTITPV